MSMMVRDTGGLICPMFNDWVDATSDRVAGWEDGYQGHGVMNFHAPMTMWVAD